MSAIKEQNSSAAVTPDREIVISREFDAPREMVWKAFTDPTQVVQWWGPNGFTTTIHEMDVRPGGRWRHTMHGPDGTNYSNASVFKEVVKPERIVYSHGGGKEDGPGVSFEATWTFEAVGEKTRLTGRSVFATTAMRELVVKEYGAIEGGKQTLARLDQYLEKAPVVVERTYGASIDAVWKAITEVEQMKQWYMPALAAFEPKVGFETAFSIEHEGKEFPHIWKITEVVPGEKIAYSWKFPGHPGESLATFELFPEGGNTRLKLTHDGLETHDGKNNPDLARKNFAQGWTQLGTALQHFLERTNAAGNEEFSISRVFDAPRELVWKALTEPARLDHWWGPKGSPTRVAKLDLRPGGTFLYCMKTPDGKEWWGKWVYREIVAPEKMVTVVSFTDEKGNPTRHPLSPTWPLEVLSIATLSAQGDKTKLTVRSIAINATTEECKTFADGFKNMEQGFTGTWNQLADYLASAQKESKS
jgi:uncharacterized protein YndB with AHSA1/START domain